MTVTDCFKKHEIKVNIFDYQYFNSIILRFNLLVISPNLTKSSNFNSYQQKLYNEVKMLKDELGLGYWRISYVLYDKGYRGIRKNSILKYNYIYSIYHKGKIREKRINRKFKTVVKDIMIYESLWFSIFEIWRNY